MDELRTIVAGEKPDVLALSETWTNENIGDGLIGIDGYELVVRKDRSDTEGGRGGGLVVYARRDICAWNAPVDTDFSQCVTIKVKCGREDFSIHSVYRSPNSNGENDKKLVVGRGYERYEYTNRRFQPSRHRLGDGHKRSKRT